MSSAVEKGEGGEELTPDGYESLFDGRETERVANLIIGAPGPDTLSRSAAIFMKAAAHRQVYFQSSWIMGLSGAVFAKSRSEFSLLHAVWFIRDTVVNVP